MTTTERNEAIALHKSDCTSGNPALYVGTYRKYNNGSLSGAWIDLTTFADEDEFYAFCKDVLHADEEDPELMFQDYENIPDTLYSECGGVSAIYEWLNYSEDERDIIEEYWDEVDAQASPDDILDRLVYEGDFDDFAEEQAEEMLACSNADDFLRRYFDYKSFANDLSYDYNVTTHYVFC